MTARGRVSPWSPGLRAEEGGKGRRPHCGALTAEGQGRRPFVESPRSACTSSLRGQELDRGTHCCHFCSARHWESWPELGKKRKYKVATGKEEIKLSLCRVSHTEASKGHTLALTLTHTHTHVPITCNKRAQQSWQKQMLSTKVKLPLGEPTPMSGHLGLGPGSALHPSLLGGSR